MRCKLFVPGSRPELFPKAMKGEADAIAIDLEDAVDASRKDEARQTVAAFLRSLPEGHGKSMVVRVNGVGTSQFQADIEAIVGPGLDVINLPMPESGDEVREAARAIAVVEKGKGLRPRVRIMANIETPRSFRRAYEIASADPMVEGLQLGLGDLLEPYGIERYDPQVILHFQLGVKLAAAEAGVYAFDSAMADVNNVAFLEQEAATARRLGFVGKSAIHPSQVAVINGIFRPTEAEIAHSLKVVASAEDAAARGVGAWVVDGKMIDAPFVARARAVLDTAAKLGLLPGSQA